MLNRKAELGGWAHSAGQNRIDDICGIHRYRLVANDNTVRIDGGILDFPKRASQTTHANLEVLVSHHLTGWYRIFFRGVLIATERGRRPNHPATMRRTRSAGYVDDKRDEVTESLTGKG